MTSLPGSSRIPVFGTVTVGPQGIPGHLGNTGPRGPRGFQGAVIETDGGSASSVYSTSDIQLDGGNANG